MPDLTPGLREARPALAAGILWLLGSYLLLIWRLPNIWDKLESGFRGSVWPAWIGNTATLTLATFAAYLIGIVTTGTVNRGILGRIVSVCDRRFTSNSEGGWPIGVHLIDAARSTLDEATRNLDNGHRDAIDSAFAVKVRHQHAVYSSALQAADQSRYDDLSRLESEASMRLGLVLPMSLLAYACSSTLSPWSSGLLGLLAVILAVRGLGRALEARALPRLALLAGVFDDPLVPAALLLRPTDAQGPDAAPGVLNAVADDKHR